MNRPFTAPPRCGRRFFRHRPSLNETRPQPPESRSEPRPYGPENLRVVPVVLAVSGSDPSGGAGIQADIEALASMGCHTAPIITALTLQNTRGASGYRTTDPELLAQQMRLVCADLPVAACKIGMTGDAGIVEAVCAVLGEHAEVPVVLDPVLVAGGGGALADERTLDALLERLVPLATIVTPNSIEARRLAPAARTLDECARQILARGAEYVLITGTHEDTPLVVNSLYGDGRLIESWPWERLPGSYHGSGCTLAAAIAGLLAYGATPEDAVRQAQEYTWEALRQAYSIGTGQRIPNRLFWAQEDKGIPR